MLHETELICGPEDLQVQLSEMQNLKRQKGESLRYRTPLGTSLESELLPHFWGPPQKALSGVWKIRLPKPTVRNLRKIHSPRFKIKHLLLQGTLRWKSRGRVQASFTCFLFQPNTLECSPKERPWALSHRKACSFLSVHSPALSSHH